MLVGGELTAIKQVMKVNGMFIIFKSIPNTRIESFVSLIGALKSVAFPHPHANVIFNNRLETI